MATAEKADFESGCLNKRTYLNIFLPVNSLDFVEILTIFLWHISEINTLAMELAFP